MATELSVETDHLAVVDRLVGRLDVAVVLGAELVVDGVLRSVGVARPVFAHVRRGAELRGRFEPYENSRSWSNDGL